MIILKNYEEYSVHLIININSPIILVYNFIEHSMISLYCISNFSIGFGLTTSQKFGSLFGKYV